MMKFSICILLFFFAVVSCSPRKDVEIKPEIRQEMEVQTRNVLSEFLLDNLEQNYSNASIEILDITEEQFEFNGDLYGTYQVRFNYSLNDGDSKICGSGVEVFSDNGDRCYVSGDEGIFIDEITVNGMEQDVKTSKYSLYKRKWD